MGGNVLILCNTKVFPSRLFQERGVDFFPYYDESLNPIFKIFRRLTLSVGIFRRWLWYGKWFYRIREYETILLFAINGIQDVVRDIQNHTGENQRKIIYFWDPVFRVSECLNYPFEKWSFDKDDCNNHQLYYNSTFYFNSIAREASGIQTNEEKGVYFIGLDKGRGKKINELDETFKDKGIITRFMVFRDHEKARVSFEENLENLSACKAILDLTQQRQSGLTVRVMESIFLEKKLITNNQLIRDQEFYHPDNIFILGDDNLDDLVTFLSKPYFASHTRPFQDYFDFDSWLKRFDCR